MARLFIAVNFDENTRGRLVSLRDELRNKSARGNFTNSENLHLTLIFLGECDERQAAAAKASLCAAFEPFEIVVERVGRFKRGGGELWWAGLRENPQLDVLRRGLFDRLSASGFAPDTRAFSPHITIGREVVTDAKPWAIEPFGETVKSVELMKSERIGGKLVYTAIASNISSES